jgi:hypothetical protein
VWIFVSDSINMLYLLVSILFIMIISLLLMWNNGEESVAAIPQLDVTLI